MPLLKKIKRLEEEGFNVLPYGFAKTEEEAIETAHKIGYPVVLKVESEEISHKTDVGGVKLNIDKDEVLRHEFRDLKEIKGFNGVVVQKMARSGLELIIGGKKDPQFGHMVVLGLGGIYVEVFEDVSARLCPVKKEEVEDMIDELKSHKLLEGARNKKVDKEKLKELVIKTCKFMKNNDIKELDLNPVICDEKGCDVVDARFSR